MYNPFTILWNWLGQKENKHLHILYLDPITETCTFGELLLNHFCHHFHGRGGAGFLIPSHNFDSRKPDYTDSLGNLWKIWGGQFAGRDIEIRIFVVRNDAVVKGDSAGSVKICWIRFVFTDNSYIENYNTIDKNWHYYKGPPC